MRCPRRLLLVCRVVDIGLGLVQVLVAQDVLDFAGTTSIRRRRSTQSGTRMLSFAAFLGPLGGTLGLGTSAMGLSTVSGDQELTSRRGSGKRDGGRLPGAEHELPPYPKADFRVPTVGRSALLSGHPCVASWLLDQKVTTKGNENAQEIIRRPCKCWGPFAGRGAGGRRAVGSFGVIATPTTPSAASCRPRRSPSPPRPSWPRPSRQGRLL